jgi:hypothetical protein
MQTIRELGATIWSRPWLQTLMDGLNRLHMGFTYAAISAAMLAIGRMFKPAAAQQESNNS